MAVALAFFELALLLPPEFLQSLDLLSASDTRIDLGGLHRLGSGENARRRLDLGLPGFDENLAGAPILAPGEASSDRILDRESELLGAVGLDLEVVLDFGEAFLENAHALLESVLLLVSARPVARGESQGTQGEE